jgi:23S rRNA (uracil1939-C5)-methyltransferase
VRKKHRAADIPHLAIDTIAAEGRGLGRSDGKVVFVNYAVPGDIVTVQPQVTKKDFVVGNIRKLEKAAPYRQEPFCKHFGICGGCKWQHVPYEKQLAFKQQLVEEAFQRIGKLSFPEINPILAAPESTFYRNKLEYTFSDKGWLTQEQIESGQSFDRRALGFHVPGRFDGVMQIDTCYLQHPLGNEIRNFIDLYARTHELSYYDMSAHSGLLRNLIIRNTLDHQWMVIISFGENNQAHISALLEAVSQKFPEITSLNYVVNTKMNDTLYDQDIRLYKGEPFLLEQLGRLKFKIGTKSFFQTNSRQAFNLYEVALKMADPGSEDVVYDLYTGTGTIALYMADKCKKVIGIETVEEAIADARENAAFNGIENADFVSAQVENILDKDFLSKYGYPDVVMTDPPRAGMHPKVVAVLNESLPKRIIYVSCNPATQARDLQLLQGNYHISAIQPVDMFPHTHHIETVVRLDKK